MAINETLKFSWGHIIAFVAMVIISYVSFMGITYLTDGDFILAGIGVIIIDSLLIVFFIGPQLLKGADEKFKRRIVFERILFFTAPIVFCLLMIPYAHFWTVFDRRGVIEKTFSTSIDETKEMFVAYKTYADARVKEYDTKLGSEKAPPVSRKNKVQALKLQLAADNYSNLKDASYQWIDRASKSTVWNVFMLGNINSIGNALNNWNSSLTNMSQKVMSDEPQGITPFTAEDPSVIHAINHLASLKGYYSKMQSPSWIAVVTGLILMVMLSLPYVVQSRNTKSTYRLVGREANHDKYVARTMKKRAKEDHPRGDGVPETINVGDYDSFSID